MISFKEFLKEQEQLTLTQSPNNSSPEEPKNKDIWRLSKDLWRLNKDKDFWRGYPNIWRQIKDMWRTSKDIWK